MLVRYEMKKLISGRTKWIILFIILINALAYYYFLMPHMKTGLEKELYAEMTEIGKGYSSWEKAYENLYNDMRFLSWRYGGSRAELSDTELKVYQELEAAYREVLNFDTFKVSVESNARTMLSFSIFADKNSFSGRNILKTADDLSDIRALTVLPADGTGLLQMETYIVSDILMLILLCFISFQVYGIDAKTGINKIISSTPKGEKNLKLIQLCVISSFAVICAALIYGSNMIQTGLFAGFPELTAEIHGIEEFRNIPYPCSVGLFLILHFSWKLFYIFSTSAVIQLIAYKFESGKTAWIITGGLAISGFLLWFCLPSDPVAEIFRYLNIIGLADTKKMVGDYLNLNLFGYPAELKAVGLIMLTLCFCLSAVLLLHVHPFRLKPHLQTRKNPFLKRAAFGLARYEAYKICIVHKAGLLLLLVFLFSIYTGFISEETEYLSPTEYYYDQFAARLSGKSGDDLAKSLHQLAQQPLGADGQAEAYILVEEQCNYLEQCGHDHTAFVNSRHWSLLFLNKQSDLYYYILFSIVSIFLVNGTFQIEYKNKIHSLIRSAANGNKIYWYKWKIICIHSILFSIFMQMGQIVRFEKVYGIEGSGYAIQSLSHFSNLPFPVSIKEMIGILLLQRLLAGIAMAVVLFLLSQFLLSSSQFIAAASILFVIPSLLLYVANTDYINPVVHVIKQDIEPGIDYIYYLSSWPSVYGDMSIGCTGIALCLLFAGMLIGYIYWEKRELPL